MKRAREMLNAWLDKEATNRYVTTVISMAVLIIVGSNILLNYPSQHETSFYSEFFMGRHIVTTPGISEEEIVATHQMMDSISDEGWTEIFFEDYMTYPLLPIVDGDGEITRLLILHYFVACPDYRFWTDRHNTVPYVWSPEIWEIDRTMYVHPDTRMVYDDLEIICAYQEPGEVFFIAYQTVADQL